LTWKERVKKACQVTVQLFKDVKAKLIEVVDENVKITHSALSEKIEKAIPTVGEKLHVR
jgi:nucleosome binding factor SPN SPT16 subunit